MNVFFEIIEHTLLDSIKLIPFLFLTYLLMEYIEHKTSNKVKQTIQKSGKLGPLFGWLVGIVPQCGFSVSATNLYAARVMTLGTLISVYLTTSDEMLPILISENISIVTILTILGIKLVIGIVAGFIIDFIARKLNKNKLEEKIVDICEHEHCHCENGIVKSALKHTINIFIFIVLVTFIINIVIHFIGEDTIASFLRNQPILGPIIAGIIGLIPNCASSVLLVELYIMGGLYFPALVAGLSTGAGVGLFILVSRNKKHPLQSLGIIVLQFLIGVISGLFLSIFF